MKVYHFLVLYVVCFTGLAWVFHYLRHAHWNVVHMLVDFFCVINILISCWEVSLWRYIDVVEKGWKQLESRFHQKRTSAALELFNTSLSFREAFSLRFWTRIWSVYSLYDCGYSDQRSYGFYIDIGNGHSMLIPSLLWMVNSTLGAPLSARWLGMVGLLSFYQMLYGTILYFLSFFANKKHVGKSVLEVVLFVGLSNGIWIVFPLLGMYSSAQLVLQGTFAYVH